MVRLKDGEAEVPEGAVVRKVSMRHAGVLGTFDAVVELRGEGAKGLKTEQKCAWSTQVAVLRRRVSK